MSPLGGLSPISVAQLTSQRTISLDARSWYSGSSASPAARDIGREKGVTQREAYERGWKILRGPPGNSEVED